LGNYNADASTIESAIDAEIPYGVSGSNGGPWTLTSNDLAPFIWTGYENAGSPLRAVLGIEIETDTSLPYKHFESFSNVEMFLDLT